MKKQEKTICKGKSEIRGAPYSALSLRSSFHKQPGVKA